MRAPLTVVIPTLNAEPHLPTCLAALWEGVQAGILRDVVVVDGGSDDATIELAREAGAEVIKTAPSRGGQLGQGGAAAQGDWILFLHADTVLEPGWSDAVIAHIRTRKAGYFRLRFDSQSRAARIVAGWANIRSRLLGLPFGDQGLLVPNTLYKRIGGYPDIPLMEDVVIARRLRQNLRVLDGVACTLADRYLNEGWLRRGGRNIWTFLRFQAGVSPERLALGYRTGATRQRRGNRDKSLAKKDLR